MNSQNIAPRPTRRGLIAGALVASTGLIVPRSVLAQDATPSAVTEPIRTLSREEFVTRSRRNWGTRRPPPRRDLHRLRSHRHSDHSSIACRRRSVLVGRQPPL
jgi:hypothetical protein